MNITHPIKVKVYWNLHKKCFSVQHKGLVIAHVNHLTLEAPVFKVSEAGRQRVLATRRKKVHAFVVGWWNGTPATPIDSELVFTHKVTYNPYKYDHFVFTGDPLMKVKDTPVNTAYLINRGDGWPEIRVALAS